MKDWLDQAVAIAQAENRVVFVCRTSATARALYRRLAQASSQGGPRGYAHVQVVTLAGMLAAAAPKRLTESTPEDGLSDLPENHPWQPLLRDRPALRRELRAYVAHAHACALAGADLGALSTPLRSLVDEGWWPSRELEGARRLLQGRWHPLCGPMRPGQRPPPGACIAVGFGDVTFDFLGQVSHLDRAVLQALEVRALDASDPRSATPGAIQALKLPDIAAEARAVVRAARPDQQVLVLVPDALAEERVRAALERNGVAVADDGASPLSRHSLATVALPLLPVYASRGQAPLSAQDLLRLFTDPVLSRRAPVGYAVPAPSGAEEARASVRHLREFITQSRRARATVAEWEALFREAAQVLVSEMSEQAEDRRESGERRLASLRVLCAQLGVLRTTVEGEGRLGDIATFLSAIRLSDPEDTIGHGILRALRDEAHRPAELDAWQEALSGSVGSRKVGRGVEILTYAGYDGRTSDLLLLTGVHDKGIGKAPPPTTFLTDDDRVLLGLPKPAEVVRGRLSLARWAASRANASVALVTETDSTARRVSPPVELELAFDEVDARASHGFAFEIPERQDARAFAPGAPKRDAFSQQIDAEWARGGAVFAPVAAAPEIELDVTPLEELLARRAPRIPEDLRAWLGQTGQIPGSASGLPENFTLSASRLQAFTNCLYRAFAQSVLRIKPVEDVEEDLDSREVGNAVHRALQHATEGVKFVVPNNKLEKARSELVALLQRETAKAIREESEARPAGSDTEPLRLARDGLSDRWAAHWAVYAEDRIRSVAEANESVTRAALKALEDASGIDEAVALLGPGLKKTPLVALRKNLCAVIQARQGEVDRVLDDADGITLDLAKANAEIVRAQLKQEHNKLKSLLSEPCAAIAASLSNQGYCEDGDLEVVARELGFESLALQLGRGEVPVHGSIDALLHHRGLSTAEGTTYRVVDFKTGGSPGTPDQVLSSVIRPQLPFYALVVEALGPVSNRHPAPVRVNAVAYDLVRSGRSSEMPVRTEDLDRIRQVLGKLLDRARDGEYAPIPHPRACPVLSERGAYCDYADVCRVRAGIDAVEEFQ